MEFVLNILKVLLSSITTITGLIKIYEFIKEKKEKLKTIFFNPIGKVFTISLIITALVFLIPWKRIHIDSETAVQKPTVIHDTVTINKNLPIPIVSKKSKPLILNQKTKVVYVPVKENSKSKQGSKLPDTNVKNQTISSGSNAHIINGNGNSVGVNGDQYTGIKPRQVDDATILYLIAKIPSKQTRLDFSVAGDTESHNYFEQIKKALISKGYIKINPNVGLLISPSYKTIPVLRDDEYGAVTIEISSQSNVQ